MSVRRTYVDARHGQVHARLTPPVPGTLPLVCLHATAYSSQSFLPLMAAMAGRRQLIALDAPGYGESDPLPEGAGMADYAGAMLEAVDALAGGPVAVLGYHTGVYVATEMAIARPETVRRLMLIGMPYFQALDFDHWKAKLAAKHVLGDRLEQFAERWDYFITGRHPGVTLQRGFANFVDELKAWPDGARAHEAMFAYPADARLPLVDMPVLVFNPAGHLAAPSRIAGAMMRDCTIEEQPGLSGPVLELFPDRIAAAFEGWCATGPAVAEELRCVG